jgi:hypothetical protein
MSKAEEKSQNRYPTLAEKYAFIDGYEQAEKDNELTWKDIEKICLIAKEVHQFRGFWSESVYQEVLKRFNKERKEK